MSQPNIDFMMNMTKDYLQDKIESTPYALDFQHELKLRYSKMKREDDDYCYLIYEDLYKLGVLKFDDLDDDNFKKLIRKHYNYIKKIAREGFY